MSEIIENLMERLETMDRFSKGDKEVCDLWTKLCARGDLCLHADLIRSKGQFIDHMYALHEMFITHLQLHKKIEYIAFYERYTGKTWLGLYIGSNNPKGNSPTHDTTGWWRDPDLQKLPG
jgi:hypothetical protein